MLRWLLIYTNHIPKLEFNFTNKTTNYAETI